MNMISTYTNTIGYYTSVKRKKSKIYRLLLELKTYYFLV